jgi:hypothetical protein
MNAVQPPGRQPVSNFLRRETKCEQLPTSDDSVLPFDQIPSRSTSLLTVQFQRALIL